MPADLLWTALVVGLAGSLHCAGMCGPLALAVPGSRGRGRIAARLLYNAGRISAYVLIGVLFGLFGQALRMLVYQQTLSLVAGGALLAVVLLQWLGRSHIKGFWTPWTRLLTSFFAGLKNRKGLHVPVLYGVLNGLLPCGLVYFAAAASLNQGHVLYSMAYMAFFGLGTLPVMLGISLAGMLIGGNWTQNLRKASPAVTGMMACLFLLRGLGLGIPYLSPHFTTAADNPKAVHSCCIKK